MAEYIEREALLEDIENTLVFSGRPDRENPKQMGAKMVVQRIKAAPPADVAPVVHGRWHDIYLIEPWIATGICSNCDAKSYMNPDFPFFNYCPNCGARMDGE